MDTLTTTKETFCLGMTRMMMMMIPRHFYLLLLTIGGIVSKLILFVRNALFPKMIPKRNHATTMKNPF